MTDKQVAIVTGASRGIGAAAALEFAHRGYHLALTARGAEQLGDVARQAHTIGVETLVLPGDLADMAFVESIAQSTAERFGRIDVLVNNAAWREIVTMRSITLESWEKTLRVCLTAPAFLARWAAEHMEPRRSGVIVNVSSIMSQQVGAIAPAYVACKGALDTLTYELASLYGQSGIRVVAISPGAIDTELNRDYPGQAAGQPDPMRAFSEDMITLRRLGQPEEIARAIAWVASDEASYLTGTVVVVDGGWRHQHLPHSLKKQQFSDQFT